MKNAEHIPLVTTIRERCRMCYTCVRECPAKAIRIVEGQAEVISKRCIGCGNCVRVCSQNAKQVASFTDRIELLLNGPDKVAACIAPSFPAEFDDVEWQKLVGMLRALKFDYVNEVSFGADIVAREYRKLIEREPEKRFIATTCPALVAYVERYAPDLVENLAPVVSPMVATARALRKLHGDDLKIVFIGPCIAKMGEAESENLPGEVNAVITFRVLREMFAENGITPDSVEPSEFDPPHGGTGALFPISRGLLQAADISDDILAGKIVVADGRADFVEAIKDFHTGDMDAQLLEVLCCTGCIMGAGMTKDTSLFSRRGQVGKYVRERLRNLPDPAETEAYLAEFDDLDMTRTYVPSDQRLKPPSEDGIQEIMGRMGKFAPEDELNCGACGYETCREHAIAIFKGMAESEMCLPYTIEQLRKTIDELDESHMALADTQNALMQSEKLASMGQLAAGIAHEVNNPLGVVLMYAHILQDQYRDQAPEMAEDLAMIAEQADRCKKIVAGLLHFSRQNKLLLEMTDLNALVRNCVKAILIPKEIKTVLDLDASNPAIELDGDQISQVLTNLITNAVAAMENDGGELTIKTLYSKDKAQLIVSDTGIGIPEENIPKIFDPFFTTKQIGKGTGLGLAVTYGIIKMHRGDIKVDSNADKNSGQTGTTFTITFFRKTGSQSGNTERCTE